MTAEQLADKLVRRFKSVPDYEIEDAKEAVEDVMTEKGYDPSDDVPSEDVKVILLVAQIESAWSIAFSVASYFKYTDGEESVDKTKVAENYRNLALDLQVLLEKEEFKSKSGFSVMPRPDRP